MSWKWICQENNTVIFTDGKFRLHPKGRFGLQNESGHGFFALVGNGDVVMRETEENGRELRSIDIIRHRVE